VEQLRGLGELRAWREAAWRSGAAVGFVPTMGALHEGHRSLVEAARRDGGRVVVSVFVNPLQFDDAHDFARYPRDLRGDLELAGAAGADAVFTPSVEDLYPLGDPAVTVDPGPFATGLEGSHRPGHFRGVATVVAKLFALVAPARAYFGEKDYEQLLLVRRLVADLSFSLEVVACPTVREPDGLARSSRNARLDPSARAAAPVLYRALEAGRVAFGTAGSAEAEAAMRAVLGAEALAEVDYAVCRDPETLGPLEHGAPSARLLVAARFRGVRLIDNLGARRAAGEADTPR